MADHDGDVIEPEIELVTINNKESRVSSRKHVGQFIPTDVEQRLLDVLLDPFHRLSSVTKQCELANVSRQAYYRAFKNDAFVTYYRDSLTDLIKAQGGQLVNIAIREARKGSYQHWKALMEMGGFYNEKGRDDVNANLAISVRFVDPESDE